MITTQILMGWTLVSVQMQFQEALKKCSPIDVDKEQLKTVHQEPILKYPFVAGVAIKNAAKGLFLGEDPSALSPEFLLTLQKEKAAPRNHYVHVGLIFG
jgi:hypothetical protein